MTDYGHDLLFGTFLTPLNRRSQDVVTLASSDSQDVVSSRAHAGGGSTNCCFLQLSTR